MQSPLLTDGILAKRLKSLSHPDRLRLLRLLAAPEQFPNNLVDPKTVGICVNDLAKTARLPQSTTSYHLTQLQTAGIITATDHGPWRYIRIDAKALSQIGAELQGILVADGPRS